MYVKRNFKLIDKDLHPENYKMLIKKKNQRPKEMERYTLWSQIGTFNIVMMSILPELIHKFNAMTIKIQAKFFIDMNLF